MGTESTRLTVARCRFSGPRCPVANARDCLAHPPARCAPICTVFNGWLFGGSTPLRKGSAPCSLLPTLFSRSRPTLHDSAPAGIFGVHAVAVWVDLETDRLPDVVPRRPVRFRHPRIES
jgi:hypothetical protein